MSLLLLQIESSGAPDVPKTSSPRHQSADDAAGPSPHDATPTTTTAITTAATANVNSNNNTASDSVNPYVAQILVNMPPLVQPPATASQGGGGASSERGKRWREEKEKEMNERYAQLQSMMDKISSSGVSESSSSLPSDSSKSRAPTTLV